MGRGLSRIRLAATVLGVAALGCVDFIVAPEGDRLPAIFSVVESGDDSVFVFVGVVGPAKETGPSPGAVLTFSMPSGSIPLAEMSGDDGSEACGEPPGFTCYVGVLSAALEPGDYLRLDGQLADGTAVTGRAVIPEVPPVRISGYASGDTVRVSDRPSQRPTFSVPSWPGLVILADSAFAATVWLEGQAYDCRVRVDQPWWRFDLRRWSLGDEVILRDPSCAGGDVEGWDSLSTDIVFSGYDENATGWYFDRGPTWPDEGGAWGVEGVVGLMGAAAHAAFTIHVTAQ